MSRVIQLRSVRDLRDSFDMETHLRVARELIAETCRHAEASAPHLALASLLKAKGALMEAEAIRVANQKSKEQT